MADSRQDHCARLAGAGSGGIVYRTMLLSDLGDAMRLKTAAGWDQLEDDWRLFLELDPQSGTVAVHDGLVIGTVTDIRHGPDLAWIGMVIVDPGYRRRGIGTALVERTLARLEGCASVMLDATAAGRPVYERLGFRPCGAVTRLQTAAVAACAATPRAERLAAADLPAAARLDAAALGGERGALLERLLARAPSLAWKACDGTSLQAFCLGRPGAAFHHIGPVVAQTPEHGIAVVASALATLRGRPAIVDVVDSGLARWLREGGFAESRSFVRMVRGREPTPPRPQSYLAAAGGEVG